MEVVLTSSVLGNRAIFQTVLVHLTPLRKSMELIAVYVTWHAESLENPAAIRWHFSLLFFFTAVLNSLRK